MNVQKQEDMKLKTDPVNRLIVASWNEDYKTIAELVKKKLGIDFTPEQIRGRKRNLRKKFGDNLENLSEDLFKEILEQNNFSGDWSHGWLKTDSASIFIRNKEDIVTYEDMRENLIADMKKHAPKYPVIKRAKIKDEHMFVIDPADVHINKLALAEETGDDYNIEIAKKRCLEGVLGLLEKAKGFGIDKIALIVGNDILHTDSPFRKTTSGTPQDTDSQWWKAFIEAKKLYVDIIEHLVTVADVHVVYCPSNHDYMSGFMLADSLSSWFHKSKNITFDVSIKHRKYIEYGLNMIMVNHGDGHKMPDLPIIMASEEPQMWARTKFRHSYLHHLHHKIVTKWLGGKDYHGVTAEHLRTPSGTDGWHDRNGYMGGKKAVEGFLHHKENGQVARFSHYF
jgi:hypothetical protein